MARDRARFRLSLPGGGTLRLGERVLVMGILNVTPDSFSDGGRFLDPAAAVERGLRLAEEGADLLDVGGESTRPGAEEVSARRETDRVVPVVERLVREAGIPVSVDTRHGETAQEALRAGAALVNDVSGVRDPALARAAAEAGAPVVVMHMRGTPADMRERAVYEDVAGEVLAELREAVERAAAGGVPERQVIVDPGIGFAKTAEQSAALIRELPRLRELGRPILVGPSRKSFLAGIRETGPGERLALTLGALAACVANGAHVLRVHDVREAVDAVRAFEACFPFTG